MKKLLLILVILTLAIPAPAATLFCVVPMQGGSPVLPEGTKYTGYVLHIQKGNYGLYQFSGSAAEMTALAALPSVVGIGVKTDMEATLPTAVRNKLNTWLTNQGLKTIPAGSTVKEVLRRVGQAVLVDYNHNSYGVRDPEEVVE